MKRLRLWFRCWLQSVFGITELRQEVIYLRATLDKMAVALGTEVPAPVAVLCDCGHRSTHRITRRDRTLCAVCHEAELQQTDPLYRAT